MPVLSGFAAGVLSGHITGGNRHRMSTVSSRRISLGFMTNLVDIGRHTNKLYRFYVVSISFLFNRLLFYYTNSNPPPG